MKKVVVFYDTFDCRPFSVLFFSIPLTDCRQFFPLGICRRPISLRQSLSHPKGIRSGKATDGGGMQLAAKFRSIALTERLLRFYESFKSAMSFQQSCEMPRR
ncbi:MAG: hypothetical protein ACOX7J_04015 [Bacillota bacterium]